MTTHHSRLKTRMVHKFLPRQDIWLGFFACSWSLGPMDDKLIDTPDGPMTWAEWKKKNPVQIPSRRTKGKNLPNKVKQRTDQQD